MRLAQGGHDVTLLARGERLAQLRQWGIVLHDVRTDEWTTERRVACVDHLSPDAAYDLGLVVMRKNQALMLLPALAAGPAIPTILFMMNNAAGPQAFVQALGRERVMTGFPMSAGYRDEYVMHVMTGRPGEEITVPIGEVDGHISARTDQVAAALARMPGFRIDVRPDMDVWHKYHVALLMPSLAAAFYVCGEDRIRMTQTPDALLLAVRAIREGFAVLGSLGYPMAPASLRIFDWLPEPLLVGLLRRRLRNPLMEVAMAKHAGVAWDEVQHLAGEFRALIRESGVLTPAIDRLYPHLVGGLPAIPEGSAELPLNRRPVWIAAGAIAGALAGAVLLGSRRRRR